LLKLHDWEGETDIQDPVSKRLYDNMPYYLPVRHFYPREDGWYLPYAPPELPSDAAPFSLEVVSSHYDSEVDRRRVHLKLKGPSHNMLIIDATETEIVVWSIGNGTESVPPREKECYILYFASGNVPSEFNFWIEAVSDKPIAVTLAGHYLDVSTPLLREMQLNLPLWALARTTVSLYQWRYV
jgi:hypothetical protein